MLDIQFVRKTRAGKIVPCPGPSLQSSWDRLESYESHTSMLEIDSVLDGDPPRIVLKVNVHLPNLPAWKGDKLVCSSLGNRYGSGPLVVVAPPNRSDFVIAVAHPDHEGVLVVSVPSFDSMLFDPRHSKDRLQQSLFRLAGGWNGAHHLGNGWPRWEMSERDFRSRCLGVVEARICAGRPPAWAIGLNDPLQLREKCRRGRHFLIKAPARVSELQIPDGGEILCSAHSVKISDRDLRVMSLDLGKICYARGSSKHPDFGLHVLGYPEKVSVCGYPERELYVTEEIADEFTIGVARRLSVNFRASTGRRDQE